MSYGIQVWASQCSDFSDILPKKENWKKQDKHSVYEGKGWQISVWKSVKVLPEDIPIDISKALPGIQYLFELNLSPITASKTAQQFLQKAAKAIAKQNHGVVFNPQTDVVENIRGVKRFASYSREERLSITELSWWFLKNPLQAINSVETFFEIIESNVSEALPRRYGLYEPPQFQLKEEGKNHLISFMSKNISGSPVIYPHRPFTDFSFSILEKDYTINKHLGFKSNRVSMGIEHRSIEQPGWQEGLLRLWRNLSEFLRPFYGEVRTLDNYMRMGATVGSDTKTSVHPVRSWFWRGIPCELGHAIVVDEVYAKKWPDLLERTDSSNGLHFFSVGSWFDREKIKINIPSELAQKGTPQWVNNEGPLGGWTVNWVKDYPDYWPFEKP